MILQKILLILTHINGEKTLVNQIKSVLNIVDKNVFEESLEKDTFPIRVEHNDEGINLFGVELKLGIGVSECNDAILVNKTKIKRLLRKGKTSFPVVIRSKSNSLYFYYEKL